VTADRELHAEIFINASPEAVWDVLTDLKKMAEGSPELLTMVPLRSGGLRLGQTYLGINRRKAIIWSTRNVVSALEPGKVLAWDTATSGATWIYELSAEGDGTRLVHRRPVRKRLTLLSRAFAPVALGGSVEHADELEEGMAQTIFRIKTAAESAAHAGRHAAEGPAQ
jgi:uncharacterized protein YndB with AHSA1/START domain